MRVLLIDDHALSRDGLRLALLAVDAGLEVLEAAEVDEGMALVRAAAQPIDLIVLDLHLKHTQGLDSLVALRRQLDDLARGVRVVVVSGEADPALVTRVLDHAGTGFIPKASSRALLHEALSLTLAGGVYLPTSVLGPKTGPTEGGESPAARLTAREREVAALLLRGYTYKQIARAMAQTGGQPISEHTVRVHVGHIAWKLGVTQNAKSGVLVAIARLGLTFP